MRPARALVLGATMCLANPKIIALVLAGMTSLAYLPLSTGQIAAVAAIFLLLGSSPMRRARLSLALISI